MISFAIDFDGTLVKHKYPGIGEQIPYAFHYVKMLQGFGCKIFLWTMRSGKELDEAVEFCKINRVEFNGINKNDEQLSWTNSPKLYAHIYIDDSAFGCPLIKEENKRPYVDWSIVGPELEKMLTHSL